ncbi:mannose-1-phosphate guanylyltransferase [Oscillatoriales cyanobacterium LEGE 11467]|uniref:Mannose-1-phosphate guanylyltransferase n=1 Tax=Zarconia navalis LEGE 11467 TaxID=1828826 RepID=A0A928Z6H3_9CYAN|nr:mannose-1-phosphate guanylyltransferase [Zarconia navalis]MBE9040372.1 mannose-1-phosphate guanylyltransferase [Zarconia navalis LEGE 11467]
MSQSFVPVILAGGKGERFWPLSRKQRPKQFLSLDGSGMSLLQSTAQRLCPTAEGWEQLWVVTASHLASGIREQLPQLPQANLLVEPEGRDTAPAVAWTTLEIAKRYGEDTVVGFFPADHWIADREKFDRTLDAAVELASVRDAIVTLGVKPGYAATGYGYIEQGDAIGEFGSLDAYRVTRFTEKPDTATAEEFLATGRFSWNSGIFVFRAGVALSQLRTHAPELMQMLEERGIEAYPELPKTSIDYALMEKTDLACVLPVAFGWDDLGDWNAIERLLRGDEPNVELANHVGQDTEGAILYASNDRDVIVTIGLEDILVVRDGDVTLVVKKDRTQDIKQILKAVRDNPKYAHLL